MNNVQFKNATQIAVCASHYTSFRQVNMYNKIINNVIICNHY
uniref:Uncharacterized protein n=1 Tax=Anguilla anguilla TaxID=7936 RepID=A0A0E9UR28_ANGAN